MANPESNPERKSLEVITSPQNENLGISIDPNKPYVEKGVILDEITVRRPSSDLVMTILKAQSEHSDRLIIAEWFDKRGVAQVIVTINSNQCKTPHEIRKLSEAITGANRLSIQKVLRF